MRITAAIIGAAGAVALTLSYLIATSSYNLQGYVVVGLAAALILVVFALPRIAATEGKLVAYVLTLGILAKTLGSRVQLNWALGVKQGVGDVSGYHSAGVELSDALRHLDLAPVFTALADQGTGFPDVLTGLTYTLIGPTLYGGALAFALMAVFGAFLYYRAFRTAFPGGNKVLYAMLIFLEPSILYWPSLQGKEAPMMVLIGLFALGLAKALKEGNFKGYIFIVLGIIGVTLMRPHIGAMLVMAAGGTFVLRPIKLTPTSLLTRIVTVVLLLSISVVVVVKAKEFVGLESLSVDAVLATMSKTLDDATEAGSSYNPPSLTDPLGLPKQIITVFYRPFPWEAHRMVAFILSLEGMTLLGITVFQHRAIRRAIFSARKNPYVIFILLYILGFMVAFMAISNFSILGRQRLMMMPFFFMLLCHPKVAQVVERVLPQRKQPQPRLATQPY
ncbi:MAG: hypothetical protein ACE5Q6_07510 [Dehalococcoidia bacterium]